MSVQEKKSYILQELRKNGCRITNQRQLLIDIIYRTSAVVAKRFIIRQSRKIRPSAWQLFTGWSKH